MPPATMDSDPWADTLSSPPQKSAQEHSAVVQNDDLGGDAPSVEQDKREEDVSSEKEDVDQEAKSVQEEAPVVSEPQAEPPQSNARDDPTEEQVQEGEDDGFDDFDDFASPSQPTTTLSNPHPSTEANADDDDDGFGDFGDFGEGDAVTDDVDFGESPVRDTFEPGSAQFAEPEEMEEKWRSLELRPIPPQSEIVDQLSTLLAPLLSDSADFMTDRPVQSARGLGQVLVSESSRDTYAQLTTPPLTKPLDWTRSRVRRDHLISMGVPVNLDEVDSHRLSALPPLRITTNAASSSSAPGGRPQPRRADTYNGSSQLDLRDGSSSSKKGKGRDTGPMSAGGYDSRSRATPTSGVGKYGLERKPEMDMAKAEELCGLEEDRLSLLPISTLRQIQEQVVQSSATASATLAWGLQLKDAQAQDSRTYNSMISSLIANAARAKQSSSTSSGGPGGGGGGVFRRSSLNVGGGAQKEKRPQSVGGGMMPKRMGSPGMW